MASSSSSGQALAEYLLVLAVLLLALTLGLRAVRQGLGRAEEEQAYYYILPSP